MDAAGLDRPQWIARAGAAVLIVLVAAVALNGYVVVVEIAKAGGFLVDQFFLTLICGLVAAGALAVATSGFQIRGRTLLAIEILTVTTVDSALVAEVDDGAGLTVVTRSGRRVQPYVCGRTLFKQLNQNMRLRTSGEAIRAWSAGHLDDEDQPGTPVERRSPRWSVLIGVPAWGVLCGVLTVALHSALH